MLPFFLFADVAPGSRLDGDDVALVAWLHMRCLVTFGFALSAIYWYCGFDALSFIALWGVSGSMSRRVSVGETQRKRHAWKTTTTRLELLRGLLLVTAARERATALRKAAACGLVNTPQLHSLSDEPY